MAEKKVIEIIVPCLNEEKCIRLFYNKIIETFKKNTEYDYKILYINDGSSDHTLVEIKKVAELDDKVKYLSFARNFGKESAMYAGFENSTGDYVVVMDADLQHPPELLAEMAAALEAGFDCAAARRVSRKGEPVFRSIFSMLFYKFINRVTVLNLLPGATDYRMITRQVVESILTLEERERFTKGIYSWIGYDTKWIEYENVERVAGETNWSFKSLLNYATSGFVAFATTPLRGVIYLGSLVVMVSMLAAIYVAWKALNNPAERNGYASIIIIILLMGGMIITILGVIGEYLARIYMEVKKRPIYIVKETNILPK